MFIAPDWLLNEIFKSIVSDLPHGFKGAYAPETQACASLGYVPDTIFNRNRGWRPAA
jgi:hypothetical protein